MNKILKAILIVILASLTLGLLITGCYGSSEPSTAVVGQPAPDFQLQNPDGQSISLSDFKGKTMLINFWNTGCPPCRDEMPYLQQLYDEMQGEGLVVLTVHVGQGPVTATQFMQDNNLSLPVLLDTDEVVGRKYGIMFFPTTFFIDKDGIIQGKVIGPFRNKEQIEGYLIKIVP